MGESKREKKRGDGSDGCVLQWRGNSSQVMRRKKKDSRAKEESGLRIE